ncbi:hypothetical protein AB1Y20_016612 [Prymnesium parvum]|uniref:PPM-type phosphatase domain-containing protein n=1 Tax=Prymnesium parvum TaxID=97485 RepID=A0AB34IC57_PRYPA
MPTPTLAEENARMREELSRVQLMVLHYAQVVLDQRLRLPSTTDAERHQIPNDLLALRKAVAAVGLTGGVLTRPADADASPHSGSPLHSTPPRAPPPPPVAVQPQAVQAELARLRMQVAQLSGQCKSQQEELGGARRVLLQIHGKERDAALPLWQQLAHLRDDIYEEREARRHEMTGLTADVSAGGADGSQPTQARDAGVGVKGEGGVVRRKGVYRWKWRWIRRGRRLSSSETSSEVLSLRERSAELQAESSRLKLELQAARATEAKLQQSLAEAAQQLRLQQAAAEAAASRAEAAEAELKSAEEETRTALPAWQEQLQRAEAQLRQLSAQLREKDAKVREQEGRLQAKDVELGEVELARAEARAAERAAAERAAKLAVEHEALQAAHHKALSEQNDSDAKWQLMALQGEHSRLELPRFSLTVQSLYDEVQAQRKELRRQQQVADDTHRAESAALRASLDEARMAAAESDKARHEAERALDEARALMAEQSGAADEAVRKWSKRVADAEARGRTLERELALSEAAVEELRKELHAAMVGGTHGRRVDEMEGEIAELKQREKAPTHTSLPPPLRHTRLLSTYCTHLHSPPVVKARGAELAAQSAQMELLRSRGAEQDATIAAQLSRLSALEAELSEAQRRADAAERRAAAAASVAAAPSPAPTPTAAPPPTATAPPPTAAPPQAKAPSPATAPPPAAAPPQAKAPSPATAPPPAAAPPQAKAPSPATPSPPAATPPSTAAPPPTTAPPPAAPPSTKPPPPIAARAPPPAAAPAAAPPAASTVGASGEFEWSGEAGSVACFYASGTHIGGSGHNPEKKNQDALFTVHCDDSTVVWGVLDGHGYDNGGLAAQTAASVFSAYFKKKYEDLTLDPQACMRLAFEQAHAEIRKAIVARYVALGAPLIETPEGFLLEQDGQPVDGGTTATIVALLQGHLLIVANVGDSDALLGGRLDDGTVGFEQLCADHAPTNVEEYIRMAQLALSRPAGWEPAVCAYDADVGSLLEIFRISEQGEVDLDHATLSRLDELNVGFKSARGDRPTAMFVLETESYGQQKLAVTRSLGDFYMQYYGATWEPSVSCIDLFDVSGQLDQITLILGSDGLWDLWTYKDVLEFPLNSNLPHTKQSVEQSLDQLIEATRANSEELFGEDADNICSVMVRFSRIAPAD